MGTECSIRGRLSLFFGVAILLLGFPAASSEAAGPVHAPLGDPIGGFALNKACGTAVDPDGNIYASSAGNSKVEVFSAAGTHLASIPNANTPCGLAADSHGTVYVVEQATGNVVRYRPNSFPLSPSPSYGPAEAFDSSGEAKGVAVDPEDDRLYVAEGDHVMVYQADGTSGQDEAQRVFIQGATTGGTFTLEFEGQVTAPISFEASPDDVQQALAALTTIGAGNVEVEESNFGTRSYRITFTHALGSKDVPKLAGDFSALSGGAGSVENLVAGFSFDGRIGEGDLIGATAVAPYSYSSNSNVKHFLFVADSASNTVKILSGEAVNQLELSGEVDGTAVPNTPSCPACADGFGFGAAGAAVVTDGGNGHLLVYDDAHKVLDEFEASGGFLDQVNLAEVDPGFADAEPSGIAVLAQRNELQEINTFASGGTFKLDFAGEATTPVPQAAGPDQVRAALEALPAIGSGNLASEGKAGQYRIEFRGALASRNLPRITVDSNGLSGGVATGGNHTLQQGSGPGRLYISSGAGVGAKLLAFGALATASRKPLPGLSHVLEKAAAVATDAKGYVYVAAGPLIHVYAPDGKELLRAEGGNEVPLLEDDEGPIDIEVDSTGKLYVLDSGPGVGNKKVTYYTPTDYPPTSSTTYARHASAIATPATFASGSADLKAIAINPKDDHLLIYGVGDNSLAELDSAAHGSVLITNQLCVGEPGFFNGGDVATYGTNGDIYLADNSGNAYILDSTCTKVLATVSGAGSLFGHIGFSLTIAVDQTNGHLLTFDNGQGAAEEYDRSGSFVARFGSFTDNVSRVRRIAVDSSPESPNQGNVYTAFDDPAPGSFDLSAFGALSYGGAPTTVTGLASGLGGGGATLNGSVDPGGVAIESCRFEFLSDAQYKGNGKTFTGATSEPCAETPAEIGSGSGAVPVHADIAGLDPGESYDFRLVAQNEFGADFGAPAIFGPPAVTTQSAQSVGYTEATLRASIDPGGLATKYRFQYGPTEAYGQETFVSELPAGPETAVSLPVAGLGEGITYHFRVVAENEAGEAVPGLDMTFLTLRRLGLSCANAEYRTGRSANLSDCRAYELVTPADTGGGSPYATDNSTAGRGFNNWLTVPRGTDAGERLSYFVDGTLPGFDGNGQRDGYRAQRGAGLHPSGGWVNSLFGPTYSQAGGHAPAQQGVASDQLYSFWAVEPTEFLSGTLPTGTYLRSAGSFESLAEADPKAESRYASPGGEHVIFSSKIQLSSAAPLSGTEAIYDRSAGSGTLNVVSLLPGGGAPGGDASYVGTTESGAAVAFTVGGTLYLHRGNQTYEVASTPNAFAGISEDGQSIYYAKGPSGSTAAELLVCDTGQGSCAGAEEVHAPTQVAPSGIFVNVSMDGSTAFFISKEALTGPEENEAGQAASAGADNLYAYDGAGRRFVGILDPADLTGFEGNPGMNLARWSSAISAGPRIGIGEAPARSTPDGTALVFLSHAKLSSYENQGRAEVYRFAPAAAAGQRLLCVSCDPAATPEAGATLQSLTPGISTPVHQTTFIPNVTADGSKVFFQSSDQLVPEDANVAQDVYEWEASGSGGCQNEKGCLSLISSGQGEHDSFLYAMSANGHDVFFTTLEKLVGADIPGSASIYDAREEGGIPDPPVPAPCQGDSCQGAGSTPPLLPSPASSGLGNGNASGPHSCPKGKHKASHGSKSKSRCVKKQHKHKGMRKGKGPHKKGTGR